MWLFCILIVTSSVVLASADLRLDQNVDDTSSMDVFQCYARYVRSSQEKGVLLVHNNYAYVDRYVTSIRSPLTIFNMGPPLNLLRLSGLRRFRKMPYYLRQPYDMVVLLLETKKEFSIYSQFVGNSLNYQLTKHLVMGPMYKFGTDPYGIFPLASSLNIYNTVVLNWNDTRVYSHFRYGNGSCGERRQVEELGHCHQLSFDELYPGKLPKQFNGCELRLHLMHPAPAVIDPKSNAEQPLVAGYEIALVNIISRILNVTKNISTTTHTASNCFFEYPYYTDTVTWYMPVAPSRAQWKSVVMVFQAPLWWAVLVFLLLNSLVWWIAGRVFCTPGAVTASYVECVLGSLLTLLNGFVLLPRREGMRFLVVSWTLCAMVLVAAYQSQFLSVLLTPVNDEQQVTNVQELLASDIAVDNRSANWVRFMLPNQYKLWRRTNGRSNKALLQFSVAVKYLARNLSDARGKPTLVAFKEPSLYMQMCLKFAKETPLSYSFGSLLQRLVDNGIVAKFMSDVDFSNYWTGTGRENEPITLHHLDFAFIVLLLGLALATLSFLLEKFVWHIPQGWWRLVCTTTRNWWRTFCTKITKWWCTVCTRTLARINK